MLKNKGKIKLRGIQFFIEESTYIALKNFQKLRVEHGNNPRSKGSINTILNDFIDEHFVDYYTQEKEYYSQVR